MTYFFWWGWGADKACDDTITITKLRNCNCPPPLLSRCNSFMDCWRMLCMASCDSSDSASSSSSADEAQRVENGRFLATCVKKNWEHAFHSDFWAVSLTSVQCFVLCLREWGLRTLTVPYFGQLHFVIAISSSGGAPLHIHPWWVLANLWVPRCLYALSPALVSELATARACMWPPISFL